jgi:hypothetical protein
MLAVPTLVQTDAVPNLSILYKSMEEPNWDEFQKLADLPLGAQQL